MFLIWHPSQIASTTLCVHYVSGITELCLFHQTVRFHSHFETLPDKTLFFFFFKHLTFMVFLILRHIREGMLVLTISFRFCEWAMMEKHGGLKRSGQSTTACLIHCCALHVFLLWISRRGSQACFYDCLLPTVLLGNSNSTIAPGLHHTQIV